jgi:hypothetical protein
MKKHNIILAILIIFVLTFFGIAGWIANDITTKESSWREKEITGYLRDVQLITTFPNEGVYVMFMDGDFLFVNVNYFWTYSQLHTIDPTNEVKITYEINGMSSVKVTHIQEISNG